MTTPEKKRRDKAAADLYKFCMAAIRREHPEIPRVQRKLFARKAVEEGMKVYRDLTQEGDDRKQGSDGKADSAGENGSDEGGSGSSETP